MADPQRSESNEKLVNPSTGLPETRQERDQRESQERQKNTANTKNNEGTASNN